MPPKGRKTRHSSVPASSPPYQLPDSNQLYTNRDILSAVRMELQIAPDSDIRSVPKKIVPIIRRKWEEVNPCLKLIQSESVINKIVKLEETANQIKMKKISAKKRDFFMDNMDKLFDILVCKCPFVECVPSSCGPIPCAVPHNKCDCERHLKIPNIELVFIKDQRNKIGLNGGTMIMKGVDFKIAEQQENTKKKKEGVAKQNADNLKDVDINRNNRADNQSEKLLDTPEYPAVEEIDDKNDEDYITESVKKVITTTDIRVFVAECVR